MWLWSLYSWWGHKFWQSKNSTMLNNMELNTIFHTKLKAHCISFLTTCPLASREISFIWIITSDWWLSLSFITLLLLLSGIPLGKEYGFIPYSIDYKIKLSMYLLILFKMTCFCFVLFCWPVFILQFSHSVVSDSLRSYGLQHSWPPCVYTYKCLLIVGFPGGSAGKESVCDAGNPGSVRRLGRSPGEEKGNPLQYSCLENSMDRGAWQAPVHGVTKSWTQLSDYHSNYYKLCDIGQFTSVTEPSFLICA